MENDENIGKLEKFELNKIYCMDCIDGLKKIPDKSIDLILTDPPYNLDFSKYDNLTDLSGGKFHHIETLKWDLKEKFDLKEVSKILFKEFDRVLKPTGSIIIFGNHKWAYYYYEPAMKNNLDFKCQLIWIKNNPIPQTRHKNYRSAHENILWFARKNKKQCPFNFNFTNQKDMKNVFEFPILSGKERLKDSNNKALHPTQKPLKLIKRLIEIHSNKGDIVLDCFAGSGTTGVACIQLERNFILIEKEVKYAKICEERLKPYLEQKKLLTDKGQ